jgi:ABC-type bacteriocin/lantibiotic exporter with double-glycine peptidase domain
MTPLERFKNLIFIDKQDIYQIILYSVIGGLVSLSLPLGIQSIINFIQAGKISTSWIVLIFIVVIGVAFVGYLKIMQYRITENLQQKIFVRSSFEFAYRFPKVKFNELQNQYPPELANRFFDTLSVQKGFSKLLLEISGAALQILFGILLLSLYHTFFIFFGFILLALLYLIFKINFKNGLETSLNESKYKYKVAHWIQEIARNHLSFKNNSIFNFSMKKNDILVNEYLKQRENHFRVLLKQFIQLTTFKVIITAGLLIIGGLLVINQKMNIGQFVAAEIIILSIITAVEKLFTGLELFYDVLTSLEKLGSVVDMELEEDINNISTNYNIDGDKLTIDTDNLTFSYPKSDKIILKNVNLSIKAKEHTLILGENGSGKSTLIHLLARLIEPSSGSIFINNTDYKKYSSEHYRSKIGIITADEMPFDGTILENIICNNPKIKMETVFNLMEKLKLTEAIKALPKGLDTPISSEGKQISSSTIQRIVLARCIVNQPKLLFLENPLDKSDEQTCREIIDYLSDDKNPWTLVVVSKNSYWKQICKQTIHLVKGEIKTN